MPYLRPILSRFYHRLLRQGSESSAPRLHRQYMYQCAPGMHQFPLENILQGAAVRAFHTWMVRACAAFSGGQGYGLIAQHHGAPDILDLFKIIIPLVMIGFIMSQEMIGFLGGYLAGYADA